MNELIEESAHYDRDACYKKLLFAVMINNLEICPHAEVARYLFLLGFNATNPDPTKRCTMAQVVPLPSPPLSSPAPC